MLSQIVPNLADSSVHCLLDVNESYAAGKKRLDPIRLAVKDGVVDIDSDNAFRLIQSFGAGGSTKRLGKRLERLPTGSSPCIVTLVAMVLARDCHINEAVRVEFLLDTGRGLGWRPTLLPSGANGEQNGPADTIQAWLYGWYGDG